MMTGVELWVKIYSPNVRGIEVVQRALKRARRARLFYMRFDVLSFLIPPFFFLSPAFFQSFYKTIPYWLFWLPRSFCSERKRRNADTFGGG